MATKFFFIYIGSFFALSIALLLLVKQFAVGFSNSGKKPVIYGTFSSVIASLAAYCGTLVSEHMFTVFWFLAAVFLLFGIIHMMIVHKKYFSPGQDNNTGILLAEILFGLSVIFFTIVVFSSLQYFVKEKGTQFLFYPMMMSTLTFFIPMLVWYTFDAADRIPSPDYTTWLYPVNNPIDLPADNPREKLLVIGFEISKSVRDIRKNYFRAKAPENIKLGELYYHFINDYNELNPQTPIEFSDRGFEPHEWLFRMKRRWYQSQMVLDPTISIRDNDVKENTVIICDRIKY
jgi:hypothetical protein